MDCIECKADCCNVVSMVFPKTNAPDELDSIKWFVAHENVSVKSYYGCDTWIISFETPCKHLSNTSCNIYKTKPQICNELDPETCIVNDKKPEPTILFNDIDDVEKYIKENEYDK